jgi:hypothetical protein
MVTTTCTLVGGLTLRVGGRERNNRTFTHRESLYSLSIERNRKVERKIVPQLSNSRADVASLGHS